MKKIEEMRAKLLAHIAKQQALIDGAHADKERDLNEAEQMEFDLEQKAIDALNKQIDRQLAVDKSAANAEAIRAVPVNKDALGTVTKITDAGADPIRAKVVEKELTTIEKLGIAAWATAVHKASPRLSVDQHMEQAGFATLANECRAERAHWVETRAVQTLTGGAGDNTIFTPLSTDFIDFLRNASAFMAGGPMEVDMSYGSIKFGGGGTPASGAYGQEGAPIGYSQLTTRNLSMSAKHLRCVTAVSNYNISVSPLPIANIVGTDLSLSLGLSIDAAGLRGSGSGYNPTGIRYQATSIFTESSGVVAPTFIQIDTNLRYMLASYRSSNLPQRKPAWVMSNRVKLYMETLRDTIGAGQYVFPDLRLPKPMLYGYPVIVSEQVPSNMGTGTNESEVYLADFGHIMMGVSRALVLTSSQEASYVNAGGTLVSAFAQDETVVRGVASHDFGLRYPAAVQVLQTVKWGG